MTLITDVSNFTKVYSTTIPFGSYGTIVNDNLGITDKTIIETNMNVGWSDTHSAYYTIENRIGAYGGYIFDTVVTLEKIELYIGRYSGQNRDLIVTLQKYVNDEWVDITDFTVATNLPYPLNTFVYENIGPVNGIRFIHYKTPNKTGNNNITFFGMLLYGVTPPARPGFKIEIYRNNSETNRLTKDISLLSDYTGVLKHPSSIIDPVIMLTADIETLTNANYMYIEKFNRYYFINDIISIRHNLCEIHAHVDVLMSFKDEILQCQVICKRQQDLWNLYLDDGSFQVFADRIVLTKAFPSGFTTQNYVLAVAGD